MNQRILSDDIRTLLEASNILSLLDSVCVWLVVCVCVYIRISNEISSISGECDECKTGSSNGHCVCVCVCVNLNT